MGLGDQDKVFMSLMQIVVASAARINSNYIFMMMADSSQRTWEG